MSPLDKEYICLLVDDDEDDREIFKLALEETGIKHQYHSAIHGKDAIQKLEAEPALIPDIIFLDLNMPVMNGKQSLVEIKKMPRMQTVPVIIYTTSSFHKDMEETKELGASHFLVKPSGIKGLIDALKRIFENKNLPFLLSESN